MSLGSWNTTLFQSKRGKKVKKLRKDREKYRKGMDRSDAERQKGEINNKKIGSLYDRFLFCIRGQAIMKIESGSHLNHQPACIQKRPTTYSPHTDEFPTTFGKRFGHIVCLIILRL